MGGLLRHFLWEPDEKITIQKITGIVLLGGLLCALIGPFLGLELGTLWLALQWKSSRGTLAELVFVPAYYPYALIATGPFGFFVGALGSVLVSLRSRSSRQYLEIEGASVGAVLGLMLPALSFWYLMDLSRNSYWDSVWQAWGLSMLGAVTGLVYLGVFAFLLKRTTHE